MSLLNRCKEGDLPFALPFPLALVGHAGSDGTVPRARTVGAHAAAGSESWGGPPAPRRRARSGQARRSLRG
eukprot:349918-Chlamydomonas_euryale.AAC.3